jgi:hypothetical protein
MKRVFYTAQEHAAWCESRSSILRQHGDFQGWRQGCDLAQARNLEPSVWRVNSY